MSGKRVLVVDDLKSSAETMAMFFEIEGHEVRVAFDGIEAVDAAREISPDVVFMDIEMPRMDGYEAARQIRLLPGGQSATLIALSGWGQDETADKVSAAGFDLHLCKPVAPDELRRILAGI